MKQTPEVVQTQEPRERRTGATGRAGRAALEGEESGVAFMALTGRMGGEKMVKRARRRNPHHYTVTMWWAFHPPRGPSRRARRRWFQGPEPGARRDRGRRASSTTACRSLPSPGWPLGGRFEGSRPSRAGCAPVSGASLPGAGALPSHRRPPEGSRSRAPERRIGPPEPVRWAPGHRPPWRRLGPGWRHRGSDSPES